MRIVSLAASLLLLLPGFADEKIIGGGDAPLGAYPWQVALVNSANPDNRSGYLCGGVLVAPQIVMTAAHCIFPFGNAGEVYFHQRTPLLPHQINVVLDTDELVGASAVRRSVGEVIIHPDFFERTDRSLVDDIALVRLDEPVESAWLPLSTDPAEIAPGTLATVTGWGTINASFSSYANRLQAVDVPIVSNADAATLLAGRFQIDPTVLAAGFAAGGKDACRGDSGGPLMVPAASDGTPRLAGLVSFGDGCAKPDSPGLYTRVASYRNWVGQHVFPELLPWEQANGVVGLLRDPDGDGLLNLYEFATGGNPTLPLVEERPRSEWLGGPDALGLRCRYRTDLPWIEYVPQHSPDLMTWNPFAFSAAIEGTPTQLGGALREALVRHPLPASTSNLGFLRVDARLGAAPAARIQARAHHTGRLFFTEAINTDGRYQDTLELVAIPGGINGIQVDMTSAAFNPFLYLINLDTGSVIETDDDDGPGNAASITFTPAGGIRYGIGASTSAVDVTGSYILRVRTF